MSQFCKRFTSHCLIKHFLPSLIYREQKLPLFSLTLIATLWSWVPKSPAQKLGLKSINLPNQAPYLTSPQTLAHHLQEQPLSPLLEPTKLSLSMLFESLPQTRRGRAWGVGNCMVVNVVRSMKGSLFSRFSRWPTLRALGLAYLGIQALWFVGEDVCSFPAAGGKVQDGSSCCYVGVFTTLTVAVRAGTTRALCVGACTRQSIRKFPWTWKMPCC